MSSNLSALFYLISGILFILALRGLSSPETSRQGNYFGIAGMVIAIIVTFLSVGNFSLGFAYVLIFILIGGSIGAFQRLWALISSHIEADRLWACLSNITGCDNC